MVPGTLQSDRADDHAPSHMASRRSATSERNTRSLLIVDEDLLFLGLMDLVLTTHGYTVSRCSRISEAPARACAEQPALVVLDLGRVAMGWAILETLRWTTMTTAIPIIACTIDRELLQRRAADLERLDVGTLAKPFRLADLLLKVERAIGPPLDAQARGS